MDCEEAAFVVAGEEMSPGCSERGWVVVVVGEDEIYSCFPVVFEMAEDGMALEDDVGE